MVTSLVQWCFLAAAFAIGFRAYSIWWLLPLLLAMGIFSWLTDRYWKIRFYDIYSLKDWGRFWVETLAGLGVFVLVAFLLGRLVLQARHGI